MQDPITEQLASRLAALAQLIQLDRDQLVIADDRIAFDRLFDAIQSTLQNIDDLSVEKQQAVGSVLRDVNYDAAE